MFTSSLTSPGKPPKNSLLVSHENKASVKTDCDVRDKFMSGRAYASSQIK